MPMKVSHLQLLSDEDIAFLKSAYEIKAVEGLILVRKKSYKRVVAHDVDDTFLLSTDVKDIRFKAEFNRLWYDNFRDRNIFEVLNAYNSLLLSYSVPTADEVEDQLKLLDA